MRFLQRRSSYVLRAALCVFAVALIGLANLLVAAEIQTLSEGTVVGFSQSDPQGPASAGTLSSFVSFDDGATIDFSGTAQAAARQDISGDSAVLADGAYANGNVGPNTLHALASWSDTVTNNTASIQSYTFSFSILGGPRLELVDYAGLSNGGLNPPIIAGYDAVISVNDVPIFQSSAELVGGRLGHDLYKAGTELGEVFIGVPNSSHFGYQFNPYSAVLPLGTLGPDESFTLTYDLSVHSAAPGFEVGSRAAVGDPFNLAGTPGFSGQINIVPEPSALLLVGVGGILLSIVAFRRRQKA